MRLLISRLNPQEQIARSLVIDAELSKLRHRLHKINKSLCHRAKGTPRARVTSLDQQHWIRHLPPCLICYVSKTPSNALRSLASHAEVSCGRFMLQSVCGQGERHDVKRFCPDLLHTDCPQTLPQCVGRQSADTSWQSIPLTRSEGVARIDGDGVAIGAQCRR